MLKYNELHISLAMRVLQTWPNKQAKGGGQSGGLRNSQKFKTTLPDKSESNPRSMSIAGCLRLGLLQM